MMRAHETTSSKSSCLTTCPYCGVGCGVKLDLSTDDNDVVKIVGLKGDENHPANAGRLCVKGSALADTTGLNDRLLYPHVADRRVTWDVALDAVADAMHDTIRKHGPDAVAFYVSGQLLTEDYYVANKLMKGFIGSANIDTNSRLCMSTAVAAHKRVFGSDSVPGCYEDLELADLIVITGSNMAWTHPVIYQRIMAAKALRPDMRLVVIDPRKTMTAKTADLHLAITPGTDGFLFDGLFAWLINSGATDRKFVDTCTEQFDEVSKASVARSSDTKQIASQCGLDEKTLLQFYQWFADTGKTVTAFCMGINQSTSGVDKASAILHCHLATGRIGKPGAAPFSLTGQPNAMGGREVGGLANQLAAHMDLENSEHRDVVSHFWNSHELAQKPGLKAVELFDAIEQGRVRFVWIMATNPVVSLPDADRVRAALSKCDHVVVSDCVADTDTLRMATIRLPAAGWAEKDGTVTNSERCISRQRAFLPLPGEAKPDWWIICEVAHRLGFEQQFNYSCPADIFREHAALSGFENHGRRDFDIGALARISNEDYASMNPVQWPLTQSHKTGLARLFEDGKFFTPSGKAQFRATQLQGAPQLCSIEYPIMLNTGRIRDQWHTMTRTARSPQLLQQINEPFVEMHPDDLRAMHIDIDQLVQVSSPLGDCIVRAKANTGQQLSTAFMPIHWNSSFASQARVGVLINQDRDPYSGQPAFKQTPVVVTPVSSKWQAVLVSRQPLALPHNHYWCGRQVGEWYWQVLAGNTPTSIGDLKVLWSGLAQNWAELDDGTGNQIRLIGYGTDKTQINCWFALQQNRPQQTDEPWLLAQLQNPTLSARELALGMPASGADNSPVVCSCHQVRQARLQAAIAEGEDSVERLGKTTRAGTNCGSCIPELKQLLISCDESLTVEVTC